MVPIIYNLRSLAVRKGTTIVTALGIALVVFVLASSLMLAEGIKRTLDVGGHSDVAVVLRKGSDAELSSGIDVPNVGLILAAPGVRKNAEGQGVGVGEVVVVAAIEKLGTTGMANVQVRGVPDNVLDFRSEVTLVSGRAPQPGTDEAMVGKKIAGRFEGLHLGGSFQLKKNRTAKVVGIFEAGGSSFESEVWAGIDAVRTSFGREGLVSSVRARLESPRKFNAFAAFVEQDKQLGLEAEREKVFYEKQSEDTSQFVTALGAVIAFFFSIGAMIGAMITMYSAVANRKREFGTMRALGFSRITVLMSVLVESLLLAVAGGALGALASMAMGFVEFSMMNFATWSEIVFTFRPTTKIITTSLIAAGTMGLFGGLLPAIRAARISPIEAMRG